MEREERIDRRKFLVISAGGMASGLMFPSCAESQRRPPWKFFTPHEGRTVEAVADQIIPPDDYPGGSWAGVAQFIDRQLTSYYSKLQERYRLGLRALDETCRHVHGESFAEADYDTQTSVLEELEKGQAPARFWQEDRASDFFSLLVDHCMQGYYGTPRHGGNRDYISYQMVQLDYPQILGRVKAGG